MFALTGPLLAATHAPSLRAQGTWPPLCPGPFHGVKLDNGVTLDFIRNDSHFRVMHCALLVSEHAFDQIIGCIREHPGRATGRSWPTPAR